MVADAPGADERWLVIVRVLVVEDEEIAASAHAAFVERVAGFELVGVARSAGEALRLLARGDPVDLVLLDMHLPDGHGLDLLQRLRADGHLCDVIAVTSARDLDVVARRRGRAWCSTCSSRSRSRAFRAKLEQYAEYRQQLRAVDPDVVQDEVDQLFGVLRAPGDRPGCPRG